MAAHEADDKPFLSRWSQRKRQAEQAAREAEAPAAGATEPDAATEEAIDPAELPDIDSLDAGADFTVFMRKGVPNALKQKALRRLWQVDPAFKHICMLDDYNQDFTDAAMVVPNLKTVYQVGRGMVLPDEDLEKVAGAEVVGPAPALPAGDGEGLASLASAEPADGGGQDAGQRPEAVEARPVADSDGAESARDVENASTEAPVSDGSRSARRRRWGDSGV